MEIWTAQRLEDLFLVLTNQKIEAEKDIPTTHRLRRFVTNPIYTDSEAIFSNDNEDHSFTANYNYSLSFWLFIHDSQSNTDGYCNILNYGDKPLIEYDENIHSLRVKIIQTVGDNKEAIEEEKIILETKDNSKNILPLQRWNNIVIKINQLDFVTWFQKANKGYIFLTLIIYIIKRNRHLKI